jgi:hypothetical protein
VRFRHSVFVRHILRLAISDPIGTSRLQTSLSFTGSDDFGSVGLSIASAGADANKKR